MLIEIIFLQELSKDLSSNPHQLPAKVILIQRIGFSKKKRKKFSIKGLRTRGIGLVLLRLPKKKKKNQSKFSIPSKNSGFPKFFKKTKKFKSPKNIFIKFFLENRKLLLTKVRKNQINCSWRFFILFYEKQNVSVGGKNLSSQLQNVTSKFSGKFQINVIKLIKLDDDMCHLNWHHISISKFATCHLAHRIKINFLFKIYR